MTVPVKQKFGTTIRDTEIADRRGLFKLLKTIDQSYRKSRHYARVSERLFPHFEKEDIQLNDLNIALIREILDLLEIDTKILLTSGMATTQKKENLVLEIIQGEGETRYLSGAGAMSYMNLDTFREAGIEIFQYTFKYPPHAQLWSKQGFVPNLSIIDLLFNELDTAKVYLTENGSTEKVV